MRKIIVLALLTCYFSTAYTQKLTIDNLIFYHNSNLTVIDEYASKKGFTYYSSHNTTDTTRGSVSWRYDESKFDSSLEMLTLIHGPKAPNILAYTVIADDSYKRLHSDFLNLKGYTHYKTKTGENYMIRIYFGNQKFISIKTSNDKDSPTGKSYIFTIYEYKDYISYFQNI